VHNAIPGVRRSDGAVAPAGRVAMLVHVAVDDLVAEGVPTDAALLSGTWGYTRDPSGEPGGAASLRVAARR
jgi:hypothetical protein